MGHSISENSESPSKSPDKPTVALGEHDPLLRHNIVSVPLPFLDILLVRLAVAVLDVVVLLRVLLVGDVVLLGVVDQVVERVC